MRGARRGPDAEGAEADPDVALLRRIAAGDDTACRMLMQRHLVRLHALATRLLDDASEAEDVCQDVFIAAWNVAPRWQAGRAPGDARFGTWLHGVALNACRDRLRRRRPLADGALDALHDPADGPSRRVASAESVRTVRAAVAALPERQREALVLCHFQELAQREAAALMGIGVDALESLLARARRTLRDQLGTPGGHGGAS